MLRFLQSCWSLFLDIESCKLLVIYVIINSKLAMKKRWWKNLYCFNNDLTYCNLTHPSVSICSLGRFSVSWRLVQGYMILNFLSCFNLYFIKLYNIELENIRALPYPWVNQIKCLDDLGCTSLGHIIVWKEVGFLFVDLLGRTLT